MRELGTGRSRCGCKQYQGTYCVPVTAEPPSSQATQGCEHFSHMASKPKLREVK